MMGIDIETYRARIGGYLKSDTSVSLHIHLVILIMLSLGLINWFAILLLLGGDVHPNPGPNNLINGILLNTRSVKTVNSARNKLIALQSLVHLQSAKIVCLTETWLHGEVLDGEILSLDEFTLHRKDRGGHGGVLVAIHNSLPSKRRWDLVSPTADHNEIVVVEVSIPTLPKMALVGYYRPSTDNNIEAVYNFQFTMNRILDAGFENVCVMGDFNLPNLDIVTGVPNNNNFHCNMYYDIFQDANLAHIVTCPTHEKGNRLDLLLTSRPEFFGEVNAEEGLFESDHFVINFTIKAGRPKSNRAPRFAFNYTKADWHGLRRALGQANLENTVNDTVDQACETWTKTVIDIISRYVPKIRIRDINTPPWIDGEVIHMSNKKQTTWRRAKRTNSTESWTKYRRLRNDLRNLVHAKYNQYIKKLSDNMSSNPKRFWGLLKAKTRNRHIPDTIKHRDTCASTPVDKANAFNRCFYSNFSPTDDSENLPEVHAFVNPNLGIIELSVAEVHQILATLDPNKATGPDEISGKVLKECADELAPSLTKLFNLSLSQGIVPREWKFANVVPVFKKGDKHLTDDYRPISLLSLVSKVLERAICNRIQDEVIHLISILQHGFLKGRSTVTQLLTVLHEINQTLDNSGQTDIIYMDFSKAFDSVCHRLLVHKLRSFGFHGTLLKWFESYLNNRHQRVVIEGESSQWLPVLSGVPQGSILGPLLFLLYVNDISDCVSANSVIGLFADDAKMIRSIHSLNDCLALQNDLDKLCEWSKKWKLDFNVGKCKLLTVARVVKFAHLYYLNETLLERVKEFKDLGVTITHNLSYTLHIKQKVAKANKALGMIRRTVGPNAPVKTKRILYMSLVRSTLMYASPVWSCTKTDMELLEKVQRRATKFILKDYDSTYEARLRETNLLPLSYMREIDDLNLYFKSRHNFCDLDIRHIAPLHEHTHTHFTRTQQDKNKLLAKRTKTWHADSFYSNRIVRLWNPLPENIRNTVCTNRFIQPFKAKLCKHYMYKRDTYFNVDNTCTWSLCCICPKCRPA